MEHGGDRRYGGHEAAQRAPASRPMRGSVASLPPAPPKVYRVEPRDFRELVQRLTGARTAATTTGPAMAAPAHVTAPQAHGRREVTVAEQFDYSSWFPAQLLSPESMPAGMDGHRHGGLL